jgi:hypothetical protein
MDTHSRYSGRWFYQNALYSKTRRICTPIEPGGHQREILRHSDLTDCYIFIKISALFSTSHISYKNTEFGVHLEPHYFLFGKLFVIS